MMSNWRVRGELTGFCNNFWLRGEGINIIRGLIEKIKISYYILRVKHLYTDFTLYYYETSTFPLFSFLFACLRTEIIKANKKIQLSFVKIFRAEIVPVAPAVSFSLLWLKLAIRVWIKFNLATINYFIWMHFQKMFPNDMW